MQNSKRIILTVISLAILGAIAYLFFANTNTEELGYTISSDSGTTTTVGSGAIDTV